MPFNKYLRNLKKFLIKILYIGKNVFCPCCGGHFRKFLPVNERYNAWCPGCGCVERHRLIFLYLKYKTSFFSKHLKVLHVAPNQKLQKIFKKMTNLEYLSINLTSDLAPMLKMDVTNLLFEDNSFDFILCNRVLEHVSNDKLAMGELFRVLKPNGWGIIQVPIDYNREKTYEDPNIILPEQRKALFGQEDHLRIYGLDYIERLKNAGFNVEIDDFINKLDISIIKSYGLDRNEKIFYVFKKDKK